ncbi:MAG: 3-deoxy-D-manno-octulosonic acid kinase [Gammaproteobacteria bacterium]|nr:3-deoxy-D-manno-octulosonic acid kinase [Gammaproteobacteria bacterium]
MLADEANAPEWAKAAADAIFDPQQWSRRATAVPAARGRGATWFVGDESRSWVLRHYRRGGFVARFLADRYLWTGEDRVRAFAEWRLLDRLWRRGLPVPRPVAARYRREGPFYRCDLITARIPDARPLSERLTDGELPPALWSALGAAIARLHREGVDHADLNAHNVLVDGAGHVSFIDFDRGRVLADGRWTLRNLRRLRRSLRKIGADRVLREFDAGWRALLGAYASERAAARPADG